VYAKATFANIKATRTLEILYYVNLHNSVSRESLPNWIVDFCHAPGYYVRYEDAATWYHGPAHQARHKIDVDATLDPKYQVLTVPGISCDTVQVVEVVHRSTSTQKEYQPLDLSRRGCESLISHAIEQLRADMDKAELSHSQQ
jgi:hypothetical protein